MADIFSFLLSNLYLGSVAYNTVNNRISGKQYPNSLLTSSVNFSSFNDSPLIATQPSVKLIFLEFLLYFGHRQVLIFWY